MHIVFSIDTPFLAPQNSFRNGDACTWWKAVYVAFTCIKTFGCRLQESAFHVKRKTVIAIRKSANIIGHVTRKISAACSLFIQQGKGAPNKKLLNGDANTDDNNNKKY